MDTIETLARELLDIQYGSVADAIALAKDAPIEIRKDLIKMIRKLGTEA